MAMSDMDLNEDGRGCLEDITQYSPYDNEE
jgi:hypothetical protein